MFGAARGVVKEDFTVRGLADETFGAKGTTLGVAGQVTDGGFPLPGGLELDVPWRLWRESPSLVGGELAVEVGIISLEGSVDEGTEAGREGPVVDEELIGLFRVDELVGGRVVGDGGNDAMDVRVVLHGAPPSVENAGDPETEVGMSGGIEFGVGDVVEGLGGAFEEEVVEDFGLMKTEGAEFLRDGEGDEEVRNV